MASKFDLNDATPAAPAGRANIQWQFDATGNVSAHVPSVAAHQTPWLSDIDAASHDLNNLGVVRLTQVTLGELDPASGLVGFANEAGTLHAKTGNGGSIDLESIGNGRVQISTDAARRIVVHQNGNVGIGPSMNPGYTLDVQGTCNVSGALTAPLSVQSALFKSSADMVFQVGSEFPEWMRIFAATGHTRFGANIEIHRDRAYSGNLYSDGVNWRYINNGSGFVFTPASFESILYTAPNGSSNGVASLTSRLTLGNEAFTINLATGSVIANLTEGSGGNAVVIGGYSNPRTLRVRGNTIYFAVGGSWDPECENGFAYFTLPTNNQLQVRVRGTDGAIRTANFALA